MESGKGDERPGSLVAEWPGIPAGASPGGREGSTSKVPLIRAGRYLSRSERRLAVPRKVRDGRSSLRQVPRRQKQTCCPVLRSVRSGQKSCEETVNAG